MKKTEFIACPSCGNIPEFINKSRYRNDPLLYSISCTASNNNEEACDDPKYTKWYKDEKEAIRSWNDGIIELD